MKTITLLEAAKLLRDAREAYMRYACDEDTETAKFIADMQGILAGDICSELMEKLK